MKKYNNKLALFLAIFTLNMSSMHFIKNNETNIEHNVNYKVSSIQKVNLNIVKLDITKDGFISTNDYGFFYENTDVYRDIDSLIVQNYIKPYELVHRIYTSDNYDCIEYNNTRYYIETNKLNIIPPTFAEINLTNQTLNLYNNNKLVLTSNIVSGKDSTPTNVGYFDIDEKVYDTYLKGYKNGVLEYNSHVYYWLPFDGGIGLNDAENTHGGWRYEFGGEIYHNNGSHGCVNLPYDNAKQIYETLNVNDMVLVHK